MPSLRSDAYVTLDEQPYIELGEMDEEKQPRGNQELNPRARPRIFLWTTAALLVTAVVVVTVALVTHAASGSGSSSDSSSGSSSGSSSNSSDSSPTPSPPPTGDPPTIAPSSSLSPRLGDGTAADWFLSVSFALPRCLERGVCSLK